MKSNFIIYGCNGYTGRLIAEHAVKEGLKPVLAGRDEEKVKLLAQELNLDYQVFDLSDEAGIVERIKDFKAVLHCAGPFKYTAPAMMKACLKAKTYYLDITGEYQVFEDAFGRHDEAKSAGILLMPGVGFDVVPTDCLSLYLKQELPGAISLELALYSKGGKLSHGTAITVTENLGEPTMIRRNGKLTGIPNGQLTRMVEIDGKQREGVAISWGDISTAFRTTRIPDITVYNVLPPKVIKSMRLSNYTGFFLKLGFVKRFLVRKIKQRPAGPDKNQREKAVSMVWGEVKDASGNHKSALLQLPEGYTLTALTAVKIVQNILSKEPPAGTLTPAAVFGADFILQFEKTLRIKTA